MESRFTGPAGSRLLLEALKEQQAVAHDDAIAAELAATVDVTLIPVGTELIRQGAGDNDGYFILAGALSIKVNNQEVAIRRARQHVGEMALIDPAAKRSASVVAIEETVVARISESDFSKVAERHPKLWRRVAQELSDRLRERGKHVRSPNPRPVVFLGCSVEGLRVAEEIQRGLAHTNAVSQVFTNDVFKPSHGTMEDLEKRISTADLAVLVLTPDDHVENEARGVDAMGPRDNVLLELGMCIGALGRQRTFFIHPRDSKVKMPTDLLGITPLTYVSADKQYLASMLGPAVTSIKDAITRLGPR